VEERRGGGDWRVGVKVEEKRKGKGSGEGEI